jgi:hypothetical protein
VSFAFISVTLPACVVLTLSFPCFRSKPHGSQVHFSVTTYEPYGVCCMQGLKISMGMHNFGEKRWGAGLLDDVSLAAF